MTDTGAVKKLDMILQFMNYKGHRTDFPAGLCVWGGGMVREGRNKKNLHSRDKKFSANILFDRR